MILPDNTPESPTKSRAGPPSEHEDTVQPPPAYPGPPASASATRYSYHSGDIEAQVPSNPRTPLRHSTPTAQYTTSRRDATEHAEHAGPRFLKAFGVAILIYLTVISLTRTAIAASWRHKGSRNWAAVEVDGPVQDNDQRAPSPIPSDGKVLRCLTPSESFSQASGPTARRGNTVSFLLPLSADLLYILGRGDLTHGTITFLPTDTPIPDGNIRVDITPHYHSASALQAAQLCRVQRSSQETGIAIVTPSQWYPSNDLSFTVEVRIPVSNEPLHINRFETHLPLFTHQLVNLKDKVTFGSINLYTENMPVHGEYLKAQNATIRTKNGRIDGNYHISRSLTLSTANQAIYSAITLYHDATENEPTSLALDTSNSAIAATVNLVSTAPPGTGGAFSVSARTQNALVDVQVVSQPVDSALAVDARTENAPASVSVPPAYEGAFELGTTHGGTVLYVDEDAADPAGRGRARVWAITKRMPRYAGGWLEWGAPVLGGRERAADERRLVGVWTTNGEVRLSA